MQHILAIDRFIAEMILKGHM